MIQRIKGYVVGYDTKAGEIVWTVKVRDQNSVHNGQKFEVASLHPGTMLTRQGIDVTFRVQDFGSGQEKVLKVVDVSIGNESPENKLAKETSSEGLNFAFTLDEGSHLLVWKSECSSLDEAQKTYLEEHGQDALYGLIKVTSEIVLVHGGAISDDEATASLAAVKEMAKLDGIRDVLCAIAAEAFKLGKRQQQ